MADLSARGASFTGGGIAPYLDAHMRLRDTDGYTSLCVAENHLVWDLLEPRLRTAPPLEPHVVAYDQLSGKARLRSAVAGLLAARSFGRPVDPEHVQLMAGAGSVIDALAHALGDPGDGVLVPTPSYAGFWPDLERRAGLRIVAVPTDPADGFRVTPERLEAAAAGADASPRILLLTNPDNPRGRLHDPADVAAAVDWAVDRGLHVVVDEVYALSVFGDRPFTSVGRQRPVLGDQVHVVWAFSKDLAMSGLRAGVLVSEHDQLREAIELQAAWGGVSGHTQWVLAGLLEDRAWLDTYLAEMPARLAGASTAAAEALDDAGIPHERPEAGFFLLADLRAHLDAPSWDAEDRLWQRVLDEAGVNLTPGSALRAPEPGWFRICYAANPTAEVTAALLRVTDRLTS